MKSDKEVLKEPSTSYGGKYSYADYLSWRLDEAGCIGAPDLIVEILSPGNNKKELQNKYDVYQEYGVKEYWIIHPIEQTLLIYTLYNVSFVPSRLFTSGDKVGSHVLPGFSLDLENFFKNMD